MQIVQLPPQLDAVDLVALNAGLRRGEITLNWEAVTEVTQPQLLTLLRGVHLDEVSELIGEESMSPAVQQALASALDRLEELEDEDEDAEPTVRKPMLQATYDTPEVWQPAPEPEEEFDFQEEDGIVLPQRPPEVLEPVSQKQIRDDLIEHVMRDLLGPRGGPEEEIPPSETRVREYYLVGVLAPDNVQSLPEEIDELDSAEEGADEGAEEKDASQTPTLMPSSIGMSFCVDFAARSLLITARWAQYTRIQSETYTQKDGSPAMVWKRQPRGGTSKLLPLREGQIDPWVPDPEQPNVYVKGLVRRGEYNWTVTLYLVNGQEEPKKLRDRAWIFQPELIVEEPEHRPFFQQRKQPNTRETDDMKAMSMLYRDKVSFAIGHGVSVHAETDKLDPTCAIKLSTTFIPRYEVAQTEAPGVDELPALQGLVLDMQKLAEAQPEELPQMLEPLCRAYERWIKEQEDRVANPGLHRLSGFEDVASNALKQCRMTLERIREGVALLGTDADAAKAFAFMNKAMWLQRIHTLYSEARRQGKECQLIDFNIEQNRSWRIFQLAFILLNLPALSNPEHPDRSESPEAIADLLWFPTGGGKTEAYLGLTAYTLAIRRLQGEVAGRSGLDGVAVIMRYTLRLLTLQQFQRAAGLICACEVIRRTEPETWGETPFRLGLWVGNHSTPNTTEESARICTDEKSGSYPSGSGSLEQLTHCPWCGCQIQPRVNIEVETFAKGRGRTLIYCGDETGRCIFSKRQAPQEGLPVLLVDEEIYRLLPALLIATVDKFAMLPHNGATQMLFGQVDKRCPRHGFRSPDLKDDDKHRKAKDYPAVESEWHAPLRPPDLIIQDELHLISGPLGTLVGLYETAVDALSTWEVNGKKVRPKVVAATATIRRADYQVQSLFMRKVQVFPPQGIDSKDNFFARQRPLEEKYGRLYMGVCANGRRMKAALIRVYLAFLIAAHRLFLKYGEAADPWLTLVGYFNSMRELGGMRRLIDDDVSTRLRSYSKELGMGRPVVEEMTSRRHSSDIPKLLAKIEKPYPLDGKGRVDVLLATNMISVGVDVKRLGLMVVGGQPKTTSEYIQATSRVGRSTPGLVCVVYNWTRPRDLSHFEQFEHYHATFYQQVEATSVTPFAPRALDRGLAALLISLVRLSGTEYSENGKAATVIEEGDALFQRAIETIVRRANAVENSSVEERIRHDLDVLQRYWRKLAHHSVLDYSLKRDGKQALIKMPKPGETDPLFVCPTSLRSVEPNVHLKMLDLTEDMTLTGQEGESAE